MEPPVIVQPGVLPVFWDRSATFVANLAVLFYGNQSGSLQLREHISGISTYGGRFVPLIHLLFSGPENLLVLEKEPNQDLQHYFVEHLGLTVPHYTYLQNKKMVRLHNELDPVLVEELGAHPSEWLDGFVTDPGLQKLAEATGKRTLSTPEGSHNGNNKYLLHAYLESCGLPVFETEMAENPSQVPDCLAALQAKGYATAAIKARIGASGIGIQKVSVTDQVTVDPFMFFEGPCMVQGWLEAGNHGIDEIESPSVQLFLNDDQVSLFDLTLQLLSRESVHEGNAAPPAFVRDLPDLRDEIFRQAGIAGQWLHRQGYRGTASVDFLTVRKGRDWEVIICEINARVTGATYPAVLARHFVPEDAWLMRNIAIGHPITGKTALTALADQDLLFEQDHTRGVMPINFNLDKTGRVIKGQFLCIGENVATCENLLDQTVQVYNGGRYDRD
jgi:hypothetical protein